MEKKSVEDKLASLSETQQLEFLRSQEKVIVIIFEYLQLIRQGEVLARRHKEYSLILKFLYVILFVSLFFVSDLNSAKIAVLALAFSLVCININWVSMKIIEDRIDLISLSKARIEASWEAYGLTLQTLRRNFNDPDSLHWAREIRGKSAFESVRRELLSRVLSPEFR